MLLSINIKRLLTIITLVALIACGVGIGQEDPENLQTGSQEIEQTGELTLKKMWSKIAAIEDNMGKFHNNISTKLSSLEQGIGENTQIISLLRASVKQVKKNLDSLDNKLTSLEIRLSNLEYESYDFEDLVEWIEDNFERIDDNFADLYSRVNYLNDRLRRVEENCCY